MLSCVVLLCCVMLCCCLLSFVSWVDFWLFWGCLGSIIGRFGVSWGVFWRSWRVLGGSWEALGGSGGCLGSILGGIESPWVVKGHVRANRVPWRGCIGGSKGGQDEAKMGPKRHQNRCQKRSRKKMLLKIVLERSWVDLGSFWVPSWGPGSAPDITPADVS